MIDRPISAERWKIINQSFGGDVERYERAHAKTGRETLSFNQLLENETILEELIPHAKNLIVGVLGFIPAEYITIPHMPFIRALILQYKNQAISAEELYFSAEKCIIPMRNAYVYNHTEIAYRQDLYKEYNALPSNYKDIVRTRLTKLLGYEPGIGTSIAVEVSLVHTLFKDRQHPEHLITADYEAFQIIKYREVLLGQGKDAADKSSIPLVDPANKSQFPEEKRQ